MRDSGGRKPFRKGPTDSFRKKKSGGDFSGKGPSDRKKSFGGKSGDDARPRKRFSDDKPFRKKEDGDFAPKSREDKPFGERKFGDKPFAKKSFGSSDRGEKKFGDKPYGKKSFGSSDRGEKKFGEKPYAKKPFGNKEGGERRFDDKPFAKKSFGSSDRGEKKFGDKPYAKKPFGNKEGGERRFDDKPFAKKSFGSSDRGEKKFGDKPDYAKKTSSDRPFAKKPFGNKEGADKPYKKSFDKRERSGDKPVNRSYKGQGNKNAAKGDDEIKESADWQVFSNADEAKEFIKSNRDEKKTHSRPYQPKPTEYKNDNRPLKAKPMAGEDGGSSIRLNRFIANTGICSRREADDLITAGVVKVNGKIVTELGTKISPSDTIHYGDQLLRREQMSYVLLNKPKDYITTTDDPQERKTVMHLIESAGKERIYPVGRLDRNTTGLLLFTNDGDLAERLTHPKYGIRKIYHVSLDKNLRTEDFDKILAGVNMEDGFMQADELSFVGDGTDKKEVGIVIHSGRNRIVRRLFEELGYDVVHLDRVVYAGLTKKNLPRSRFRHLTPEEVGMLRMQVGGEKKTSDKRFGKSQLKGKGRREKK